MRVLLLFLTGIMIFAALQSDSETHYEAITATNIIRLRPAQSIDFSPDEFETGWFLVNDRADRFVVFNRKQEVVAFNDRGQIIGKYKIQDADGTTIHLIDGAIKTDLVTMLHGSGETYYVAQWLPGESARVARFHLEGIPVAVWADDNEDIWLEAVGDSSLVLQLPALELEDSHLLVEGESLVIQGEQLIGEVNAINQLPYAPAAETGVAARIGRILPPLVITSTAEGLVKRWNLESGEVTAQRQLENGPAVFGQVNQTGDYLVWRDPQSVMLNLLDFRSGESKPIAELNQQYAQYFFLSNAADVIIAVNIGFEPNVIAWKADTGERFDLGAYRNCNRIPDMARLSANGAALVIGCNTGLEIWRVRGEG